LLLLDEPSLGLSPKLVDEVLREVRTIAARGTAVLLAEQNVAKALAYCERAYVLQVGRVILAGPAAALREADAVKRAYLGG
jgi:branched-chain amino acid transport system ATP-binding protein